MTSKMLIDASHPEETRVVVTKGSRVEEFDFESALRKQLRGNIYLAKVTRVEPSLQAAFVDFGGNRHGFLAFSEIHPDYYQIPTADRQALLDDEARAARDEEDEEEGRGRRNRKPRRRPERAKAVAGDEVSEAAEGETSAAASDDDAGEAPETGAASDEADSQDDNHSADEADENGNSGASSSHSRSDSDDGLRIETDNPEEIIEQIGGGDALEDVQVRHSRPRRQYKIQEVIKRRQILLVQVVKEERGNKGAALTTYLSLAGRYSVLMPNTARGGGISRKITNSVDRKRLKTIAQDLEVPDGMGVILRTAGASRTKTEVKRDFEYLMRLWESVRELTLQSSAPTLVYEEGSLIKRAIRDLYSKEVEEVLVAGEEGYREAKDFMKMLMPSHAKMVQLYKEPQPLFARHMVEGQLDAMFNNVVTLKSGGYIVINQTEALVSIDVNSGRSTREHNIEDTALRTNLEAAEEVARQLRLRDLAGLIVIDFIDMEEKRNNKAVERKINDCLKNDRARIQLGRISHFGLLEMSRQRIRTGVLESSTSPCPHCAGTGLKRATASIALNLVRALEEALMKNAAYDLVVRTPMEIALYVLNHKRETLVALENRFGVHISVRTDESILPPLYHAFERGELSTRPVEVKTAILTTSFAPIDDEEEEVEVLDEVEEDEVEETAAAAGTSDREPRESRNNEDGNGGRRRRRRRRRRGGRGGEGDEAGGLNGQPRDAGNGEDAAESDDQADGVGPNAEAAEGSESAEQGEGSSRDDEAGRPRRRRRRGGRRNRREDGERTETGAEGAAEASEGAEDDAPEAPVAVAAMVAEQPEAEQPEVLAAEPEAAPEAAVEPEKVKAPRRRAPARKKVAIVEPELRDEGVSAPEHTVAHTAPDVSVIKPEIAEGDEGPVPAPVVARKPEPAPVVVEEEPEDPNRPKKTGWWSKAKKAMGG